MMIRYTNLGGHSGCKVLLCELEDGTVFVRKESSSLSYNKRLEMQALKQIEFQSDVLKTPKVLNSGYTNEGLYYFDMQFIQGQTLSEYIKSMEISRTKGLVCKLTSEILNIENKNDVNVDAFYDKINDLSRTLSCMNNSVINSAISILREHDWSKFYLSKCHGDLTLENIIVKNDELYLVDFLDSFYDSSLLDIGTLLQDLQGLWSYRNDAEINVNTIIRIIVFKDILIDIVKNRLGDNYIEIYFALLLKLIRIFPYTKDDLTKKFLEEKTLMTINIIQNSGISK